MPLTEDEQQRRREWFRSHWQTGVAFNRVSGISVRRWDPDGVDLLLPYHDDLSAHDGIFHGGVIAALVDTAGCGAVAAGHDFDHGSRISTTMLSLQYLTAVPKASVVAHARCTKRGRRTHFADVTVCTSNGVVVAHGLVTVNTSGERPGLGRATSVTSPRETVRRHFEATNRRDIEAIQALFSDDAEWVHPIDGLLRGCGMVAKRYADLFALGGPDVEVISLVVEGSRAVAEVCQEMGPIVVHHYTFDEHGLITRLAVYGGEETRGKWSDAS